MTIFYCLCICMLEPSFQLVDADAQAESMEGAEVIRHVMSRLNFPTKSLFTSRHDGQISGGRENARMRRRKPCFPVSPSCPAVKFAPPGIIKSKCYASI